MTNLVRRMLGNPPVLFLRRLRSDATLGLGAAERLVAKRMQRAPGHSVYGDRFMELRDFWGVSSLRLFAFLARYGTPFGARLRDTLMRRFEGHTAPGELAAAYERTAFHYTVMLMLGMHRGEWLAPFREDIIAHAQGRSGFRVLDYGCGVSDMGMALAQDGADVTIADLAGRKLDFAAWRFSVRGLKCQILPVTDTEHFPALPQGGYDLVIATEILEHVRDPLALLKLLTGSLKPGGLFFCTLEDAFVREVGGDHLPEAAAIGASSAYHEYFKTSYVLHADRGGRPWLFRKVR
jgi:ubiquinone/menaquinone biosynthesis C-methylase UbiE